LSLAAPRRRRAQTGLAAAFLFAGAGAVLLLRFPPEQYSFYPRCPIRTYLHLQCPGCGATRALAALLHGRVTDAFQLNALFIAGVLPAATAFAGLCLIRLVGRTEFRWPAPHPRWANALIYSSLALAVAFAILRNLRG
jgi:uncharacterized protein (DUF983 family)